MRTTYEIQEPVAVPAVPPPDLRPAAEPQQLSRRKILAVWAAAAIPMGVLAWIVAPLIADQMSGPGALAKGLLIALTAGLVWQFVLVMTLVRREQGTLRWAVVKEALWLRRPQSPKTGRRGGRVWLVVLGLLFAVAAVQELPGILPPEARDMQLFLESDAAEAIFGGGWGWFGLVVVMAVFNTAVGEELLFRGYLLPRMAGAFGRRDWLANGLLFTAYHLHVPWAMPHVVFDTLILSGSSRRYRSALIGIAVHSAQSVILVGITLALVLS